MSDGIFTACGLSEQSPNPTPFVGRELFFYHESMIFVTQHLTYLIINVFFARNRVWVHLNHFVHPTLDQSLLRVMLLLVVWIFRR